MPPFEACVTSASKRVITQAVGNLAPSRQAGVWLTNNRYAKDASKALVAERDAGMAHHGSELADYIAASVAIHYMEGWNFLAASTSRLFQGDWKVALHLAYYAELRAAMSLLASLGIGTFRDYHISVDDALDTHGVQLSTHQFVWMSLERWADTTKDLFPMGEIEIPVGDSGGNLSNWLAVAGGGTGTTPQLVAGELLRSWSVDIKRFFDDRDARNAVSYRAHSDLLQPLDVKYICEAVLCCWRSCEPGGMGGLRELDRHLLRLALGAIHRALTPSPTVATFTLFAENTLSSFRNPIDPTFADERSFLVGPPNPKIDSIFYMASGEATASTPSSILPVMSRALLLLRVASAGCAFHLQQNGVQATDVAFWANHVGEGLGLWRTGEAPARFDDLWSDILPAIDQLGDDISTQPMPDTARLWDNDLRKSALLTLGHFQAAGLWSLGLP